jgi:hypothetical protein
LGRRKKIRQKKRRWAKTSPEDLKNPEYSNQLEL